MNFTHLFFDLDHTLWDYDSNSRKTLGELYEKHGLKKYGVPTKDDFITLFYSINEFYWEKYRKGLISQENLRLGRFRDVLQGFQIHDIEVSKDLSEDFVKLGPYKKGLMPNCIEVLDYLKEKYELFIITNGFEEVQLIKLRESGLSPYFKGFFSSSSLGVKKPHADAFNLVLNRVGVDAKNALMIGDNLEVDVLGAKKVGMGQVYFNYDQKKHAENVDYEISSLIELKKIV